MALSKHLGLRRTVIFLYYLLFNLIFYLLCNSVQAYHMSKISSKSTSLITKGLEHVSSESGPFLLNKFLRLFSIATKIQQR